MGLELEDEGFTAAQAARILGRAGAGWGRATYALALGRLRKTYGSRAADPDASDDDRADAQAKADLTARVLAWITGLVTAIPDANGNGKVPLQTLVDSAIAFIEHTTARKSALDHRAASALLDHVAELRALGSFSCSLPEALRFIRERVLTLQVAPERPRPGHLHVCALSQACFPGRPISSWWGSRKVACFHQRVRTLCFWTRNGQRFLRHCGGQQTRSMNRCMAC